jgi:hypothetical protein
MAFTWLLTSCGTARTDEASDIGQAVQALTYASCPACSATELAGGKVKYAVKLPSGQKYVELFVRKNGVQNVAQNITSTALSNGDGTSTYSLTVSSYVANDRIEYRFYSYLPSSPGVFTPGPQEQIWVSFTFGVAFGVPCPACSAIELDGGKVQLAVRLPSGQKYVQLFVRKNGVQNVAQNITASGLSNGDGASTYLLTVSGYVNGDRIDYRFYSYLPSSPGVFTPGPQEQAWATLCVNSNRCRVAFFDSTTATCSTPPQNDGRPCNDGNACTQNDTCQAGVCVSGLPVVCAPPDQCHAAGTCSPTAGCSNPMLVDGTACDDENSCTTGDACRSGMCVGTSNDANPACLGMAQGLAYAPHQPHRLPDPPLENGCYVGTSDGWVPVVCTDKTKENGFLPPQVGLGGIGTNPIADTGPISFVYGQVETTLIRVGRLTDDCTSQTYCGATLAQPHVYLDNAWSVQLNTEAFWCKSQSQSCLVQWVIANHPDLGTADVAIWRWDMTAPDPSGDSKYTHKEMHMSTKPQTRAALRDFDYVNLAGYAFNDKSAQSNPKLGLVVQFSMVAKEGAPDTSTDAPNQIAGLYAMTVDDLHGLSGHWHAVTGGMMGKGASSNAEFKDSEVMTLIAASSCPGDTSGSGPTCPSQELSTTNTQFIGRTPGLHYTSETDNLMPVRAPSLNYPNANLAVTEVFSSTYVPTGSANATCLTTLPDHVFIKDNDGDNGGTPSNSGGVPFWESPDIFILPASAPEPKEYDVAADFAVTLGETYKAYLRLNNDYGCNPVNNVRVLINAMDPNLGFGQWSEVTTGANQGTYVPAPGNKSVPAYGRAIIGPFTWTPAAGLSSGHKCLLAAVAAGSEQNPSVPLEATYKSNQIAQRNLIVSNGPACNYTVTNTSADSAYLHLGVNVSPENTMSASTIKLIVGDTAGHDRYNVWNAQATRKPGAFSAAIGTSSEAILTILKSAVALDSVEIASRASVSVTVDITATTSPNVALSASLWNNPAQGVPSLLVENGGTCRRSRLPPPCQPGWKFCGWVCVDVNSDPLNCGDCGIVCNNNTSCSFGQCWDIR